MSLQSIAVEATGVNLAVVLNTDDIAKLFATEGRAVNINSMTIYLATFGTAVDILIYADHFQKVDESAGGATTFPFAQLAASMTVALQGSSGSLLSVPEPGAQTFFRFTTADIAPQFKPFSVFPIFNKLIIGWTADVDFTIEFDYTVLDTPLDWREKIMDLLATKTRVEDPNISNVDGKRQLVRAPLQIVED